MSTNVHPTMEDVIKSALTGTVPNKILFLQDNPNIVLLN